MEGEDRTATAGDSCRHQSVEAEGRALHRQSEERDLLFMEGLPINSICSILPELAMTANPPASMTNDLKLAFIKPDAGLGQPACY
jgi:hypothetical protein